MSNDQQTGPAPSLWPQAIYALRRRGAGRPLAESVVAIAHALPALLGTAPFTWNLDPTPPKQITLDAATIAALLRGAFMLGDRPAAWTTMLSASQPVPPAGAPKQELVQLTLPGPQERQLADLSGMMALVECLARELGAHIVSTNDSALAVSYHGRRHFERTQEALAKLPEVVRKQIPVQTFEPIPGIAGELPELLPAPDLDDVAVPDGVQWINWWNPQMIATLGRERVLSAGWAAATEHPDGAMTLAATDRPPNLTSAADVARVRGIVEALELRGAQARHLAKR